jgi:hypothetical protein
MKKLALIIFVSSIYVNKYVDGMTIKDEECKFILKKILFINKSINDIVNFLMIMYNKYTI